MIKTRLLKRSDAPIAVAVSGGVDSIAAAHLLHRMRLFPNMSIIHFNHQFQPVNEEMEETVGKLASDLGVPYIVGRRDTSVEIPKGDSVESALRQKRLRFFAEAFPDKTVLLAHHLSDCTESHFLNFLRGRNNECPIPIKSEFFSGRVKLLRPFMLSPKSDFEKYAANNGLYRYVVADPTNSDTKYRRNWTRHVILPEIKKHGVHMETVVRKIMEKEYAKLKT